MKSIGQLLEAKPALKDLFDRMNYAHIRWAIFAGSEVALLTANRTPTDLDIIVHNADFEKLAALLPTAVRGEGQLFQITANDGERLEEVASILTFQLDDIDIDIMSRSCFKTNEGTFPTYLTDLACRHRLQLNADETTVYMANPFDTILIKAFMRRGEEQGKFDEADVKALCLHINPEPAYVNKRIAETGLSSRARQFLKIHHFIR